jgi:putative transposase
MDPPIRKTRRSWDEPGHAHFVTYSCHQRLPLLSRDRVRRWVIGALQNAREKLDLALWAYVVMPEHVHVLLHPRAPHYEMRQILVALKQPVAKAARQWLEEQGQRTWLEKLTVTYPSRRAFRFWQPGGGFDHNVFREKTVSAIVEYIHANPVRRGLAEQPTDWEWSSARFWEGWSDVPLRMDDPFG